MQVKINDQIFYVGWQYIGKKDAPTKTVCILRNTEKEIVHSSFVRRYAHDPHDKEKARKLTLTKALLSFKELENNREGRKLFWKAYFGRKNNLNN